MRLPSLVVGSLLVASLSVAAPSVVASGPGLLHRVQNVTCFKTGEWVSGMNKNCSYDCLGSQAVETISSTQLCPLTIGGAGGQFRPPAAPRPPLTCFKSGEWVSGMNKNCSYDCLGSQKVMTIQSVQLCPLNVQQ